jgi:hypothetical protein
MDVKFGDGSVTVADETIKTGRPVHGHDNTLCRTSVRTGLTVHNNFKRTDELQRSANSNSTLKVSVSVHVKFVRRHNNVINLFPFHFHKHFIVS